MLIHLSASMVVQAYRKQIRQLTWCSMSPTVPLKNIIWHIQTKNH